MKKRYALARMFLKHWPFPRGASWLVKHFLNDLRFSESEVDVDTRDGFRMRILPNEHVGRYLYLTGEFDRSVFEVLQAHSRPGDILLDVGANVGYMSACFLTHVPNSRVVAVDPQPGIVDLLRANLEPFGSRALVVPVALSDRNGRSAFEINATNRGASMLVNAGEGDVTVETWTPERLVEICGIDRIDLIKLDVEGHEEAVFSALQGVIARFRPRLIVFEDKADKAAPDAAIGALLATSGYSVKGLRKKLTRLEFPPIRSRQDCRYQDYVAVSIQ